MRKGLIQMEVARVPEQVEPEAEKAAVGRLTWELICELDWYITIRF